MSVIKEMPDYRLELGTDEGEPCYVIVNRLYNVEEVKTKLLPQAYEYLEQLQAGLDAKRDMEEDFNHAVEAPILDFPH